MRRETKYRAEKLAEAMKPLVWTGTFKQLCQLLRETDNVVFDTLMSMTGLLEENRWLAVNFRTNTASPFSNGDDSISSTNYAVGFTEKELSSE